MSLTTDLGSVTAYADAVAQGYKGTREEFGQVLANFADSATQVGQDKVVVENIKNQIVEIQTDVTSKQQSALKSANDAKAYSDSALQSKTSAEQSATQATNAVRGFDGHVTQKIEEANTAVKNQEGLSIQNVKTQTESYIGEQKNLAKTEITAHTATQKKELEQTITNAENQKTALEQTITNASGTEKGIVEAEKLRVTAEQERATAEQERVTAETARATKEQERVKAETARVDAETKRQTDTAQAIQNCNTAKDAALKAAATMVITDTDTGKTYQGSIKVKNGKPVFEYDEVATV